MICTQRTIVSPCVLGIYSFRFGAHSLVAPSTDTRCACVHVLYGTLVQQLHELFVSSVNCALLRIHSGMLNVAVNY